MAQDVNVSYDHLETVAKQLTTGQGQIEQQLLDLKKQVDALVNEGFVTDQSSKAFQSSYEEFNQGITKTVRGPGGAFRVPDEGREHVPRLRQRACFGS